MYYGYTQRVEIAAMQGVTFDRIETSDGDQINFYEAGKLRFVMKHDQDCCESVYVEDIAGDLSDLLGTPIVKAEEIGNADDPSLPSGAIDDYDESHTWTFYKLDTIKGGVTIRWYGSSNGYYSESVDIYDVQKEV